MGYQDRISPYIFNTISSRQVIRIRKNINQRIAGWSQTKFSKLTSEKLYGRQFGELLLWSGSERVKPPLQLPMFCHEKENSSEILSYLRHHDPVLITVFFFDETFSNFPTTHTIEMEPSSHSP